ncbi:hypothetical protein B0H15DRAFT_803446 [Mycena belliarum]|uniref:Uncharacterized protein n=1 Tax=Mycena belliarum TaxID=1033014 RepID=A0AAD6XMT6_9AGAR|nr:hypothetical protein B0H15DRAFT_803446 [Mycena belliae]
MSRGLEAESGKRKKRKIAVGWTVDSSGGAPITKAAGELLGKLLGIYGRAQRLELDTIVTGLDSVLRGPLGNDMKGVVGRLTQQSKTLKIGELGYMLTLIQLALNVDSLKADAALKYKRKVTWESLASTYAPSTHPNTFQDWVTAGKRLLFLSAAGTLYLLPVIAALELRTYITKRSTSDADLLSLATAMRAVRPFLGFLLDLRNGILSQFQPGSR